MNLYKLNFKKAFHPCLFIATKAMAGNGKIHGYKSKFLREGTRASAINPIKPHSCSLFPIPILGWCIVENATMASGTEKK